MARSQRFKLVNIVFPVFSIELLDIHAVDGGFFKATNVDTDSIRVGAGDVKRLDAAGFAKQVLRLVGVKGIGSKVILS